MSEETSTRTVKKQGPIEAGESIKKTGCKNSNARPTGLENKNKTKSANTTAEK